MNECMNENDFAQKYVIYGFELEYAIHDFNYMCFKCSIFFVMFKLSLCCTVLV